MHRADCDEDTRVQLSLWIAPLMQQLAIILAVAHPCCAAIHEVDCALDYFEARRGACADRRLADAIQRLGDD
jgi:hypothetical protein